MDEKKRNCYRSFCSDGADRRKAMEKAFVMDAEFTVIPPGRSLEEVRRKRRRQRWEANARFLAMQGTLAAVVAVVTALLLRAASKESPRPVRTQVRGNPKTKVIIP